MKNIIYSIWRDVNIKDKLIAAVTEWDRRQSRTRFHNPHALGIYFDRVDDVVSDIERGATIREAIIAGFCDRLQDFMLRSVGQEIARQEEVDGASIVYRPTETSKTK